MARLVARRLRWGLVFPVVRGGSAGRRVRGTPVVGRSARVVGTLYSFFGLLKEVASGVTRMASVSCVEVCQLLAQLVRRQCDRSGVAGDQGVPKAVLGNADVGKGRRVYGESHRMSGGA